VPFCATLRPMFHTVLFWLKKGITEEEVAFFESELKLLAQVPYLKQAHVSMPAATAQRPVVDHSFSFSLIVEFASMEDHVRYQTNDADHDRFVDNCKHLFGEVIVYDHEVVS
jgi:hypothetical protein